MGLPNIPLPPPPPARLPRIRPKKHSNIIVIVLTIACGLPLAVGSCFGALITMDRGQASTMFGLLMIAGVALSAFRIVWAIMALIIHIIHRLRGGEEQV